MRILSPTLALLVAGCGSESPADLDASTAFTRDVAPAGEVSDAAPAPPCSLGGTGRIRVAVTLDPALQRRAPEIWLSARCGAEQRELRLVRWDRSEAMVLDGFGPGVYSVLATTLVSAPSRSAEVMLGPLSTISLGVTLAAEPSVLATLRAGAGVVGALDAGAPSRDAALDAAEGGAPAGWTARSSIDDPMYAGVGALEVSASALSGDRIEVRVVVRNTCAAMGSTSCPTLTVSGVEARSLRGEVPGGVAVGALDRARVAPGESATLVAPMVLSGSLPGPRDAVLVALYGSVVRASSSSARRD